jgi:hypothetical protein
VLAGHDDIAQDREGCVVAGRGCDASRTVGRLGRWRLIRRNVSMTLRQLRNELSVAACSYC